MELVSIKDKETTSKIISLAYQRAAASFSALANRKVLIDTSLVDAYTDIEEVKEIIRSKGNCTVLLTELMGDLKGESYLIFSESERRQICVYCTDSFASNAGKQLSEEVILKEVDNIISAAVITEFSNQLSAKIFGDVPKVLAKEVLLEELENMQGTYFLLSNAHFTFEGEIELSPKFLWRLDSHFIEMVRSGNDV